MKKSLKIVPITLISIFTFTACSTADVEVAQEPPEAVAVLSGDRYGSGLTCDRLKDDETRKSCDFQVNQIVGMMLESEVTSYFDIHRCKELPSEIIAECEENLANTGVKGPITDEEFDILNTAILGQSFEMDENPLEFSFSPAYDKANCSQLKTEGLTEYCELQIDDKIERKKLDEALRSNDVKKCDELNSENLINECKTLLGVVPDLEFGSATDEAPLVP